MMVTHTQVKALNINPRRTREGYGSWFVCLSVCLSVATLAATYLVCESNLWYCKVPYGVSNASFVWILPKTLCSPALASFADSILFDFARASDSMTYRITRTLSACTVASIRPLTSFWRSWDDSGFFSTLRLSCQLSCVFLWYPLTLWPECIRGI